MQNKAAVKLLNKAKREQEDRKKRLRMTIIMWATGVVFIGAIALAVIFQPDAKALDISYDNKPQIGSPDAPVKVVEFGDFKCPSCQVFSQNMYPQLKTDYIDTGKVSFYFMNDTIIAQDSVTAALAAQSVFHQSKDEFWKYYDVLFKNQKEETTPWATADYLTELAKTNDIKVDYDKLRQDIDNQTYLSEVTGDTQFAQGPAKVTATPTLYINGVKYEDVFDYNKLKSVIDKALEKS